ncbi:MAG: CocE/NonD family hydrolase [Bacteroidota bacterium]|nr:CocE/NonD family hydrolase [Bacteroidota bacterium]
MIKRTAPIKILNPFSIATFTSIVIVFFCCLIQSVYAQDLIPDTVIVQSGNLTLKALLWHPAGNGPFPTIIFCHGSYGGADTTDDLKQTSVLGPVFAKKGYIFLILFRRGAGLSEGQGVNSSVLMYNAFKEKGQEERIQSTRATT